MHVRELLELGAMVALYGPSFAQSSGTIPIAAMQQYWAASKCRLDRWRRVLHDEAYFPTKPRSSSRNQRMLATIEEVLGSEILTRTWTAATAAFDRHHGQAELEPVARAVLAGQQEARHRALQLLVSSPGIEVAQAVELNRLRRRLERWSDLLLAYLAPYSDVSSLAFEFDRVEDFAADLPAGTSWKGIDLAWQLLFASLRASFEASLERQSLNGDLNRAIASSVLGCLPEEMFDSMGLVKSMWVERMARTASDTQGMIDELLLLDAQDSLGDNAIDDLMIRRS